MIFLQILLGIFVVRCSNTTVDNSTNSANSTLNDSITVNTSYYLKILPYFSSQEQKIIDASPLDYTTLNPNDYNITDCIGNNTVNATNFMACFYKKHSNLLTTYRIDFPNPLLYYISIYINPCKGQNEDLCKSLNNNETFTDNYKITATRDLLLAWFMNNYILKCGNEFANLDSCGTFIEIHRPFDLEIIEQVRLDQYNIQNFVFSYISTKQLCAGKYEIWLVFRARIGKILQYVKPFFVEFPSCGCQTIQGIIPNYVC